MSEIDIISITPIVPGMLLHRIAEHVSVYCAPQVLAAGVVVVCLGVSVRRMYTKKGAAVRRGRWYSRPQSIAVWVPVLSIIISAVLLTAWLMSPVRLGMGLRAVPEVGFCERAVPLLIGLCIMCVSVLQYYVIGFIDAVRDSHLVNHPS